MQARSQMEAKKKKAKEQKKKKRFRREFNSRWDAHTEKVLELVFSGARGFVLVFFCSLFFFFVRLLFFPVFCVSFGAPATRPRSRHGGGRAYQS